MKNPEIENSITKFREIHSIGRKLATFFVIDLDFREIRELKNKNPDDLYLKLQAKKGEKLCRCVLYSIRCVVEFAKKTHTKNWWDFKD